MTFHRLFQREIRHDSWRKCDENYDNVLDRLKCIYHDEYHIEGHDGDIVVPLSCQFSDRDPHVLAVVDEDGGVIIYDCRKPLHDALQEWRAHENAIFDVAWMPEEPKLLTASGDQTVVLWEVESETKLAKFKGHQSSIKTISYRNNDKFVFGTGSRDGNVMIWDSRMKEKDGAIPPVNILKNAHTKKGIGSSARKKQIKGNSENNNSVTCVVFQDENTLITAGSTDGVIKLWDIRKTYTNLKCEAIPKDSFTYPGSNRCHGYSYLLLDHSRSRLFASCMDNTIYQYNVASCTSQPVALYRGHLAGDFYIKTSISQDDLYLVSGSSDNQAYIWKVDDPLRSPLTLTGHQGEVSAVSWCPTDISKCVTLSDDCSVRLWRIPPSLDLLGTHPLTNIVGTCERTAQEKCVGTVGQVLSPVRHPVVSKSPLKSPHKGSVLPWSATEILSPSMRASLLAMSPSPTGSQAMARVLSPSISSWLAKKAMLSPAKSSPRKTPRKLNIILSPRRSAPEGQVVPRPAQSAKRKLLDASPSTPESKRHHIQPLDENSCSPSIMGILERTPSRAATPGHQVMTPGHNAISHLLVAVENKSDGNSCSKKLNFGEGVGCGSPTLNLPNYVHDPQPRTPVGVTHSSARERTPDWLTCMGRKRMHDDVESLDQCPSTPKVSNKRQRAPRGSSRSSPRNAKTPTRGHKSILHYMSPKTPKTNSTKES